MPRGRPPGPPKLRKDLQLEQRQIECLEALRATALLGQPSFVSLVRQAVDQFITSALADDATRARVEAYLGNGKIVKLRDVAR